MNFVDSIVLQPTNYSALASYGRGHSWRFFRHVKSDCQIEEKNPLPQCPTPRFSLLHHQPLSPSTLTCSSLSLSVQLHARYRLLRQLETVVFSFIMASEYAHDHDHHRSDSPTSMTSERADSPNSMMSENDSGYGGSMAEGEGGFPAVALLNPGSKSLHLLGALSIEK